MTILLILALIYLKSEKLEVRKLPKLSNCEISLEGVDLTNAIIKFDDSRKMRLFSNGQIAFYENNKEIWSVTPAKLFEIIKKAEKEPVPTRQSSLPSAYEFLGVGRWNLR